MYIIITVLVSELSVFCCCTIVHRRLASSKVRSDAPNVYEMAYDGNSQSEYIAPTYTSIMKPVDNGETQPSAPSPPPRWSHQDIKLVDNDVNE